MDERALSSFGYRARALVRVAGFLTLVAACTLAVGPSLGQQVCPGDCNLDNRVTIDEPVLAVAIALGEEPFTRCPIADVDTSGRISIDELVRMVIAGLGVCPPRLMLAVEVNPDPVAPGETMQVLLSVANRGPVDFSNVSLRMRVPAGVQSFSPILAEGGSCPPSFCDSGEQVTWTFARLESGKSVAVSVPLVPLTGNNAPADITVRADVQTASESATATVGPIAVAAGRPLDLALDEEVDPVAPGAELTYTLTFGNRSAALAPNAVLEMPLPAGTTFVRASDGAALANDTVRWPLGTLVPGQGGTRTLTVEVRDTLPGGDVLRAAATIFDSNSPPDTTHAAAATRLEAVPGSALATEINPNPVAPGESALVQLAITNLGPVAADINPLALIVADEVVTFSPALAEGGSCPPSLCEPRETLSWTFTAQQGNALPPGRGSTRAVPVTLANLPNGTVVSFEARAVGGGTQHRLRRSILIQANRPLDLSLDEEFDPIEPGAELTYTLTFGNRGAALAPNTVLAMPVPAGTSFVSASDEGALASGTVRWVLGTLVPGQGGTRQLTVRVGGERAVGDIVRADAMLSDASSPAGVARASAETRIEQRPSTDLSVEVNADPVMPGGESALVQLGVSNSGLVAANIDLLGMIVPDEVATFSPALAEGGTCPPSLCEPRETLSWALTAQQGSALPPGRGTTRAVPVTFDNVPDGSVVTFDVRAAGGDVQHRIRRSVLVQTNRALDLSLDEEFDPIEPGAELTYTLTFGNRSAALAPNAVLEMPVPAGTSFVRTPDEDAAVVSDAVIWSLGTLVPGEGGTRRVTFALDGPLVAAGDILHARATISDASSPPNVSRATAATRVEQRPGTDLAIEINPDPVMLGGESALVQLSVTNLGLVAANVDLLGMIVPDEVATFSPILAEGGSCPPSLCESRETLSWSLTQATALPPGRGSTRAVPVTLDGVPSGTVATFDVRAASGGVQHRIRRSVLVQANRPLDLSLDEEFDPIERGAELTYQLVFGNRGATLATDVLLEMPLPAGAGFVSASDGGTLGEDQVVRWEVGTLAPGQGGTRQIVLRVDDLLAAGEIVRAAATISDANSPSGASRATAATRVEVRPITDLVVDLSPSLVAPNQMLLVQLGVTNLGPVATFANPLGVIVPDEVNTFSPALADGGTCPPSLCESRETLSWNLTSLQPNVQRNVGFPPTARGNLSLGTVITFDTRLFDSVGGHLRVRRSVRVGN